MRYRPIVIIGLSLMSLGCNAQTNEALWPDPYCSEPEVNTAGLEIVADSVVYAVKDTVGHMIYEIDPYLLDDGMENRPQTLLAELPVILCNVNVDRYYLYNLAAALYSLGDRKWLEHLMEGHICSFEPDDRKAIIREIRTFHIYEWEASMLCD